MANSKVQDLNQMKSPQQQKNTHAAKSPGTSDAKASDQQAKTTQREPNVQGGQHGSNSDEHSKNGSAQQK